LEVLLLPLIQAGHHCAQTHYDSQENQEPCRYPTKYAGKILVAVLKHKLPKSDHFSFGRAIYEHRIDSLVIRFLNSITSQHWSGATEGRAMAIYFCMLPMSGT
jgi:hypothetical protein